MTLTDASPELKFTAGRHRHGPLLSRVEAGPSKGDLWVVYFRSLVPISGQGVPRNRIMYGSVLTVSRARQGWEKWGER